VQFSVDHDFPAPPSAVADVLCDPDFQAHLELPDLSLPEIVEHQVDGSVRLLRLRYEYVGSLDPIARRVIGSRKLTWLQELRLDTTDLRGTLTFSAEADPKKLNGEAEISIVAADGGSTRHIRGDLHVRVPLIGGTAEKKITPGLVRRLDVEAEAMTAELAKRAQ
jgi:hypothetical protein